jgi:two-component system nitrogen regulation response regulator NtrX
MVSGHGTIETAVSAIKRGAFDFIEKPFDAARLLVSVSKAVEFSNLQRENDQLKIKAKFASSLIGQSNATTTLRNTVKKVGPLNGRCFLIGPVGADKECLVSEIHHLSSRAAGPLIFVNCRMQSRSKFEVDLFGMRINESAGPSTKIGYIEKAHGGAIYFDEIHYLPKDLQLKLCRVLSEGYFSRLGESVKVDINVRVFAGASVNMEEHVKGGIFSEELYYRLAANVIKVPPLSSRQDDIPDLLNYFMAQAAIAYNAPPKAFSQRAIAVLKAYQWPGDVNQLKNFVDWILVMHSHSEDVIDTDDLPVEVTEGRNFSSGFVDFMTTFASLPIKEARETFEKEYLTTQLKRFSGNISQTSKFVGMERSALHRKIRYLKIHEARDHLDWKAF